MENEYISILKKSQQNISLIINIIINIKKGKKILNFFDLSQIKKIYNTQKKRKY